MNKKKVFSLILSALMCFSMTTTQVLADAGIKGNNVDVDVDADTDEEEAAETPETAETTEAPEAAETPETAETTEAPETAETPETAAYPDTADQEELEAVAWDALKAAGEWLYEEVYDSDTIILRQYRGTDEVITVPATMEIDGTTYDVIFGGSGFTYYESEGYDATNQTFPNSGENTIISFAEGVKAAENINNAFYNVTAKTLDLSNLDTSAVTDMSYLFSQTATETLDVSGFNTSNVTNMEGVFNRGYYNLVTIKGLEKWDTSSVTNMSYMFSECFDLKSMDLSAFDTSNVTDMKYMFNSCSALESVDLSSFNTSNVENMQEMFYACSAMKELDLSGFDTSKVTSMADMFYCNNVLESLNISGFDTSKVTDMTEMFYRCNKLESLDVSSFNTQRVKSMARMFRDMFELRSLDVSNFDTGSLTGYENNIFTSCAELQEIKLGTFMNSHGDDIWMPEMFKGCEKLEEIDISGFDLDGVTAINGFFSECKKLKSMDFSSVKNTDGIENMTWLFENCIALESVNLTGLSTKSVTNFAGMFSGCESLTSLDVSALNTSKATNMSYMFRGCGSLTSLDISGFDLLNIEYGMEEMFKGCESLADLNLGDFEAPNVVYANDLFSNCRSLKSIDLSGMNSTKIARIYNMFSGCSSLESVNLSGLGTANVYNFNSLFSGCSSLESIDVSTLDTTQLESCNSTFNNCVKLKKLDLSSWDMSKVTYAPNMFNGAVRLETIEIPLNLPADTSIDLPGTYADAYGVSYTTLPTLQGASFTITKSGGGGGGSEDEDTAVTGISLSSASMTLTEGDSAVLRVTIAPATAANTGYTLSSYDSSVINIGDRTEAGTGAFTHTITALSEGSAEVTFTTDDGGFTATLTVTVNKKQEEGTAVTGISLSPASMTLTEGDSSTLTVTISPANADNTGYSLSSYDSAVISIGDKTDAGSGTFTHTVTALSEGSAEVTFSTADGGYTAALSVTVNKKEEGGGGGEEHETEFTLGRDNNSFAHSNVSGYGFAGRQDYTFHNNKFFELLTQGASSGIISSIKEFMSEDWGGSCYGVSATIGRVFNGIDSASDYISGTSDYYSLGKPVDNEKYDDIVNYYMLSQFLNWDRTCEHSCVNYRDEGTQEALSDFLKELVTSVSGGKAKLFCYGYSEGGHAILAVDSFTNSDGSYTVRMYDLNSYGVNGGARFQDMTVKSDYSGFSYETVSSSPRQIEDEWRWMNFYDWDGMAEMDSSDLNALGAVNAVNSVIDEMTMLSDVVSVQFDNDDSFELTDGSGKVLIVDNGKVSEESTIEISGLHYAMLSDIAEDSDVVVYIPVSSGYTLSGHNGDKDVELSITSGDDYLAVDLDNFDSAALSFDEPVKVQGSSYEFEVTRQTANTIEGNEKGLVTISGKATADVSFTQTDEGIKASSDEEITGVQTKSHITNAVYTRDVSSGTEVDASSTDTTGTQQGNNGSTEPDDGGVYTKRPSDTYYAGCKVDMYSNYFYGLDGATSAKDFKYLSSDKKLAKVSGKGLLKAKKPGTVTITAYNKNTGSEVASVQLVILSKPKIKFTEKFTTLTGSVNIWKYVTPADAAQYAPDSWESTRPDIAAINEGGIIEIKGAGSAKITGYFGGLKVKASLKIKQPKYS